MFWLSSIGSTSFFIPIYSLFALCCFCCCFAGAYNHAPLRPLVSAILRIASWSQPSSIISNDLLFSHCNAQTTYAYAFYTLPHVKVILLINIVSPRLPNSNPIIYWRKIRCTEKLLRSTTILRSLICKPIWPNSEYYHYSKQFLVGRSVCFWHLTAHELHIACGHTHSSEVIDNNKIDRRKSFSKYSVWTSYVE